MNLDQISKLLSADVIKEIQSIPQTQEGIEKYLSDLVRVHLINTSQAQKVFVNDCYFCMDQREGKIRLSSKYVDPVSKETKLIREIDLQSLYTFIGAIKHVLSFISADNKTVNQVSKIIQDPDAFIRELVSEDEDFKIFLRLIWLNKNFIPVIQFHFGGEVVYNADIPRFLRDSDKLYEQLKKD